MIYINEEDDFKSSKRNKLLDDLKELENSDYEGSSKSISTSDFLPSYYLDREDKKEKKSKKIKEEDENADKWYEELMYSRYNMKASKRKISADLFSEDGILDGRKKKKKKKGKKGELTDFKREFEPEMALYKNLLQQQNKFTESLQREYDSIKSVKSSSRGVTKQMSDLIENITSARSLSMQLVDKHVNAKKLIAELSLKEKKELGQVGMDTENMADYASSYLKQMINERRSLLDGTSDAIVGDYSDDEMLDEIDMNFTEEDDRPEEIDKYLKYENRDVQIYVVIYGSDVENYEFIAKDKDGIIIEDYPLPNHTSISVNWSTEIATDLYGKKYPVLQEEALDSLDDVEL